MARDSILEVAILRKKTQTGQEIDKLISRAMDALRQAISTEDERVICRQSRALADEVDHAWSHPEVWPEVRVQEVFSLLQQAAEATVGSEYEENCAARPQEFLSRLETLLNARDAVQRIREVAQSISSHPEL